MCVLQDSILHQLESTNLGGWDHFLLTKIALDHDRAMAIKLPVREVSTKILKRGPGYIYTQDVTELSLL
jgi:hypothetical protein